jgi:uncharacterized protein YjbI with pentapeptide repeats
MIKDWVKIIKDTNLKDTNLSDTNLSDTNLKDANLSDTNLKGGKLSEKNVIILNNISEYLILWFSSLIDVYTIFSIVNNNKVDNNKIGNNMIILCGEAHRKILSAVLCGLFGYKIDKKLKDYDNCLRIDEIKF